MIRGEAINERHNFSRGQRYAAVPINDGYKQAAAADIQQTHDFLPAFDLNAGGYSRDFNNIYAA